MANAQFLMSVEGGGWRLTHAEGHVLFPGANHVETLAVFCRGERKIRVPLFATCTLNATGQYRVTLSLR